MSDRMVGILFLPLAGVFGWMVVGDYRRGEAELPRIGWRVHRRSDPAWFWALTAFSGLMLSLMLFATIKLLLS